MKRIFCLMLSVLMLLSALPALAEMPNPTISPNAPEYDAEHPELLEADQLACAACILIEESSGDVIFSKNADAVLYPASTTKIMTVMLGLMYGDPKDVTTVSYAGSKIGVRSMLDEDSSVLGLKEGEEIVIEDLLYGTILRSGNDGAITIAEYISGNETAFVNLMNQTAQQLGMKNTHFMNSHGLHHDNHYTTAEDMAVLARAAMQYDLFREIARSKTHHMPETNKQGEYTISTGHRIMLPTEKGEANKYYYDEITGIKSGSHSKAAYCYVGSASRDGVDLISVVLYSNRYDVWRDTKKLMEYGFTQYSSMTLTEMYEENPLKVYTIGYAIDDTGLGELYLSASPVDPGNTVSISGTFDQLEYQTAHLRDRLLVQYTRELVAPITAGEKIGTMTYTTDDGRAVVYNLLATRTVPARTDAPPTIEEIIAMTEADPNPMPPLTLEVALIFLSPVIFVVLVIVIVRFLNNRIERYYKYNPRTRRKR